jgi:hypothetical protein
MPEYGMRKLKSCVIICNDVFEKIKKYEADEDEKFKNYCRI